MQMHGAAKLILLVLQASRRIPSAPAVLTTANGDFSNRPFMVNGGTVSIGYTILGS